MISKAKPENLDKIATLHQTVLGDTFASQVGRPFVAGLYKVLLNSEPLSMVFIEETGGEVKGFISLSRNRIEINGKVDRFVGFLGKLRLAIFVLLHPMTVKELYNKVRLDHFIEKNYEGAFPSIITLGVSPKFQGKGIGRELVLSADRYFKENSVPKYFVDTEVGNKGAIKFYRKLGFRPAAVVSGNVILEKNIKLPNRI